VPTPRSDELRALAQRVADALPPNVLEVVLTGSVSRGVADDVSDIEMLVVPAESVELDDAYALARTAGLDGLDTWGAPGTTAKRVSGYRDGEPLELIFWPREFAAASVDALAAGERSSAADALAHGVPLRTSGLLADWQARLREYPESLAVARIEEAALRWGGFTPAGLLTVARPGDRLATVEWLLDAALRVLTIVYALNRVWEPTTKRLAARVEPLAVKPPRLAERIEEALTEPDPRRALLTMTELQLEAVELAPSGPNVDRARRWLAEAIELLSRTTV
jgi:predicted nucleotidyltransferase